MDKFAIFINTTDKFEDCWYPFFKLFSIYWPSYKGKIYLNTEHKQFDYPGLNIISIKNCADLGIHHKNTWSECLISAMNFIEEETVLYMQEDYFLNAPVKTTILENFVNMMCSNNIDCLHLTDQNTCGPFAQTNMVGLWLIDKNAKDRVSCQAALWKKNAILQYAKKWESPWQFETNGTKRSCYLPHVFYTVDRSIYIKNNNEIIPYIFTGVIQGRWFEEVVDLFKNHEIEIDFSKRGFVQNAKPITWKSRMKKRIVNLPTEFISSIDLLIMRYKTIRIL